jgi:hypothetical protein
MKGDVSVANLPPVPVDTSFSDILYRVASGGGGDNLGPRVWFA